MFWKKTKEPAYNPPELIDTNGYYYNLAAAIRVSPVEEDSDWGWVVRIEFPGHTLRMYFTSGSAEAHRFRDNIIARWRTGNK